MTGLKTFALRAAAMVALVALLYAIKPAPPAAGAGAGRPASAVLFVNGTLGDKSFYDSAERGLRAARDELGLRTRVVEAGNDPTRWESALADLVEGQDFDVVITGGFAVTALVQRLAPQFPRTRFIVFDAAVDPARCRCENVHSIRFRQSEGSYLAGHLAARVAQEGQPGAAPLLGFVGGMQIPVIDDFHAGFAAGAQAAAPGARIARQYVNSFTDPATAKEIAKAMYGQGAGLVFHAAGGSGQGVIEAASEAGRPVIGVDADQYAVVGATHPARARVIVTSVMKNVDVAIRRALQAHHEGRLVYGGVESLGLAEGGVSLAPGAPRWTAGRPELKAELDALQRRIAAGALRPPSVFAREAAE
ncbi:MAG TPA: BMP family ABC transporter substrate-binding protein [Methylibium sp.]|uniref:BMP family lipoprotein n=1 Tax=Methylibium sp. TaxID=2067992 RepID=UPI002DBDF185|nr:BMP family ABC transporter substrate-binding protein [Methylibium sp.]HEU4460277.1 BMP family ABC transporter substrate-binding protein [Methylibium sp.]